MGPQFIDSLAKVNEAAQKHLDDLRKEAQKHADDLQHELKDTINKGFDAMVAAQKATTDATVSSRRALDVTVRADPGTSAEVTG